MKHTEGTFTYNIYSKIDQGIYKKGELIWTVKTNNPNKYFGLLDMLLDELTFWNGKSVVIKQM